MLNLTLGLMDISSGLLLIIVCLPLVKRKIKMNRWYGMRLPKAFVSENNWYNINEYGGRQFIYWSMPVVLSGVILLLLPPIGAGAAVFAGLLPAAFLAVPMIKLFIYSGKL
jgi:hypothetical protein